MVQSIYKNEKFKLKAWRHPATGELRLYVAGICFGSYVNKVWLTQSKDSYNINVKVSDFSAHAARHKKEAQEAVDVQVVAHLGYDATWQQFVDFAD